MKSTPNCLGEIERLKAALKNADSVLIGAGAGLSTSAGYTYSGERFTKYFSDFERKYGFRDMYSGGFYPFDSAEEFWAYWSRYVYINRYTDENLSVYRNLFEAVKDKDYFVLTTNVDHCFQKAGLDKTRLFYTQGDYGLFQCSEPCNNKTYDNEENIRRMVAEQKDMKIPTRLLPRCPVCGKPMTMNLRSDDKFVEDDGWNAACVRYERFVTEHKNANIVYLELGVGSNTPVIIKYPFWRFTNQNPNAVYACVNYGEAICPPQIENRSICINADIGAVLKDVIQNRF